MLASMYAVIIDPSFYAGVVVGACGLMVAEIIQKFVRTR